MEGGDAPWPLTFHVLSSARLWLSSVRRLILVERMMPRPDDTEFDWSEVAPGDQTEAG